MSQLGPYSAQIQRALNSLVQGTGPSWVSLLLPGATPSVVAHQLYSPDGVTLYFNGIAVNTSGGGMVYPSAGLPISTGAAWLTSISNGTGWLHNNGSGTYAYSTPTASDISTTLGAFGTIRVVTSGTTVVSGDYTIVGNHGSTNFAVTLLAASTNSGRIFVFKNKNAALMTIDATGKGQLFVNAATNTVVLDKGDSITIQSDGSTWVVL